MRKTPQSKGPYFTWQRKLVEEIDKNKLRDDKAGDVALFGHHLSQAALQKPKWGPSTGRVTLVGESTFR